MKTLRQDYYKFRRLKDKWRRPKGRQSKLRKRKAGSGLIVKIGHGSSNRGMINNMQPVIVANPETLDSIDKDKQIVIISSGVGAAKALTISEKAKKIGLKVLNKKKIERAEKIAKEIEEKRKKREEAKKKKAETKKKAKITTVDEVKADTKKTAKKGEK